MQSGSSIQKFHSGNGLELAIVMSGPFFSCRFPLDFVFIHPSKIVWLSVSYDIYLWLYPLYV